MFGISLTQFIFIMVLALILIGPKQLPEVARQLGKLLTELRRASNMLSDEFKTHLQADEFRNIMNPQDKIQQPQFNQHQTAQQPETKPEVTPQPEAGLNPDAAPTEEKKS